MAVESRQRSSRWFASKCILLLVALSFLVPFRSDANEVLSWRSYLVSGIASLVVADMLLLLLGSSHRYCKVAHRVLLVLGAIYAILSITAIIILS